MMIMVKIILRKFVGDRKHILWNKSMFNWSGYLSIERGRAGGSLEDTKVC